jgi:selenocysteine lyase/cysteine desulfurase
MGGETTTPTPFGRTMRTTHWSFSPTFTPLNHGSFGAYPSAIQAAQDLITKQAHARPDPFIKFELPKLLDESRKAIAPLLGVDVDEVVLVPTATYGVNIVLRNLDWENGDVIVHFSTIYLACLNTLKELSRHSELATVSIPIIYPITDDSIITLFQLTIKDLKKEGKKVKLAIFDTVSTFPGVRVPWEELVMVCREEEVLSCVDGAHGIGMLDFRHLGGTGPDFWFSNCHKCVFFLSYFPSGREELIYMQMAIHPPRQRSILRSLQKPTSHPQLHTHGCLLREIPTITSKRKDSFRSHV